MLSQLSYSPLKRAAADRCDNQIHFRTGEKSVKGASCSKRRKKPCKISPSLRRGAAEGRGVHSASPWGNDDQRIGIGDSPSSGSTGIIGSGSACGSV